MKKIFITGASSGIGRAIVTMLAEHGHEVWGTSRDLHRLPQMPRFHPLHLDLADNASVQRCFETGVREAEYFDVVINNAGSGHFDPAENLSAKIIADQFQILLFAQLQLMQLAWQSMKPRRRGLIINVSSLASRLPVPFMAAYNSAKAALASFTMSIQLESSASGIHIVDLQPGDICTHFNEVVSKDGSEHNEKVARAWAKVDRNMKDAPKPELVAHRILKLIEQTNPPPRITVGSTFQAIVAPLIFRFLPQRVRVWGLRNYYGI
ncbi:MAG: SDR family NAD(P)-dependent oxidoreductase [Spartobacteria bacterium]